MKTHAALKSQNPDFKTATELSFKRQQVMSTFNASLSHLALGEVDITMPYQSALCQQHGFLHAGIVSTIVDSACGYAAFTLMPKDAAVLTIEYKINLLAPAKGDTLVGQGRVIRPGQHVTVCQGDAIMHNGSSVKTVATMIATIMTVQHKAELNG